MRKIILMVLFLIGCEKETPQMECPHLMYSPTGFEKISFATCDSGIVMIKDGKEYLLKLSDDQVHLRLPFEIDSKLIMLFDVQPKN